MWSSSIIACALSMCLSDTNRVNSNEHEGRGRSRNNVDFMDQAFGRLGNDTSPWSLPVIPTRHPCGRAEPERR